MIDAMLRHFYNADLGSLTPQQARGMMSRLPLVIDGVSNEDRSIARADIRKAGRHG